MILPLTTIIILLSSCAAGSDDAEAVAAHFRAVSKADYLVHITSSFPGRELSFSLDYSYNRDGDDKVTVVAPDEISGMSFSVKGDAATLEFEGAILEMGRLSENFPSPLAALPALIRTWNDGNFSELAITEMRGNAAYLLISRIQENEEETEYRTWIAKDDMTPLYAEIFSSGERIIQCDFERAEQILQ